MVKIRLTRMGKKKQPFYRIVAIDSRVKRDGQYLELIGTYNPLVNATNESETNKRLNINDELALKWLKVGAQPTETVKSLFTKENIMQKFADFKKSNKMQIAKPKVKAIKSKINSDVEMSKDSSNLK